MPSIHHEAIRACEDATLDPAVRSDPARLGAHLADDFVEFGSSGRVWDKASVLAALAEESGIEFELSEFRSRDLGPDCVLANYRLAVRGTGVERHSLRTSIWVRREGSFQMLFHQGTVLPADRERNG